MSKYSKEHIMIMYEHFMKLYQERYLPTTPEITWECISYRREQLNIYKTMMLELGIITKETHSSRISLVVNIHNGVIIDIDSVKKNMKLRKNETVSSL